MKALWSGLNRDNSTCSITYRSLGLDGRKIWLRGTMKAEFDAAGRLMRLKGLTRDITERKQANMRIAADLGGMKRFKQFFQAYSDVPRVFDYENMQAVEIIRGIGYGSVMSERVHEHDVRIAGQTAISR
jgi:hypothetical protein